MRRTKKPIIGMAPLVDSGAGMTTMLNTYTESILAAGGIPLILPLSEETENLEQMLEVCDGFVFTGGPDVDTAVYGEEKMDCTSLCKERDGFEMKFLPLVLESDKPVLAICRGMQLLNVALGGSLYQDIPTQLPSETEHRMGTVSDQVIHEVEIVEGTPLMEIAGEKKIPVNSYHHQCVRKLGSGLEVMAYSPDGIIEGIYLPEKRFVVAVQWHPERIFHRYGEERKLFEAFIRASMIHLY